MAGEVADPWPSPGGRARDEQSWKPGTPSPVAGSPSWPEPEHWEDAQSALPRRAQLALGGAGGGRPKPADPRLSSETGRVPQTSHLDICTRDAETIFNFITLFFLSKLEHI